MDTFLDFEKPIAELQGRIENLRTIASAENVDVSAALADLEQKLAETRLSLYQNLTRWQRVQLSRHPNRPYMLYYVQKMCEQFTELHGDRLMGDDKAIVGGFALLEGQTVMVIGHQKGADTKMRQYRNFGMANPEGYRKALRLMKLAEKFNKPILCLIDTPGAYPGIEAEERGQAEAIARNLLEMMRLRVPIICVVIGEGASGGALGLGIGDRVLMLQNTWYTVISPESCSSILWGNWQHKEKAAEELKLTAADMLQFKLIDGIVEEPVGGAHCNPEEMAYRLKKEILDHLAILKAQSAETRIQERIAKFSQMGIFTTKP